MRGMRGTEGNEENGCGIGRWRPEFLQKFANSRTFMLVYGLLGTIQAMSFVYFVSTLTSLEKRFRIPSQVTGILMSGNEISQILLSIFLSYRGGKGNRPLWMAWGVLFSSLSCFILAVPHFIYGPGRNALALTAEHLDEKVLAATQQEQLSRGGWEGKLFLCSANRTEDQEEKCHQEEVEDSFLPLLLIFLSQFVLGIGTTLYVTLGQPYLDDNTKKKNTPMLLGITMALRTVGPAVGFVLGYLCLSLYINPYLTPVIDRNDPRWIGAWWLGWIILGSVMTVFSLLLALFPKKLRKNNSLTTDFAKEKISRWEVEELVELSKAKELLPENQVGFKDFRKAMKRILTNPILLSNNFSAVFYILGVAGYFNFYSKYLESQFHSSAASASMFAGVTTVLSMVVGFVVAGVTISKVRPRTSWLLAWNLVVGLIYVVGEILLIFVGCEDEKVLDTGTHTSATKSDFACYADCSCDAVPYAPVCYQNWNRTFLSPCHAGCSHLLNSRGKRTYDNCSCLPSASDFVYQGPCNVDCFGSLLLFIGIQCLIQLIGCSGRITTVLVNYRSIEPRDKELAQGLALFMVSLLAFIPGPIIYGKIIDSACLVWDNTCGSRGNCWVYDKLSFRLNINTASLCFTSIAVIFDGMLWYLGRNLRLYEDPGEVEHSRP